MNTTPDLPMDVATLQVLLRASQDRVSELDAAIADRDAAIEHKNAVINDKEDRITRLEKLLADFKRAFGIAP